jgi:hypothetical protein
MNWNVYINNLKSLGIMIVWSIFNISVWLSMIFIFLAPLLLFAIHWTFIPLAYLIYALTYPVWFAYARKTSDIALNLYKKANFI